MNFGLGATDGNTGRLQDIWRPEVVGIYPDYGNPKGQMRVNIDALVLHWPDVPRTNIQPTSGPRPAVSGFDQKPCNRSSRPGKSCVSSGIRPLSRRSRPTYSIGRSRSPQPSMPLTLVVSQAIALFASLLTLSNLRLFRFTPVWAIGVTRRRLSELELVGSCFLPRQRLCLLCHWGLILAWCLVGVVNVQAFGWRLPLYVFPDQWLLIFVLALVTAFVSSIIPIIHLSRMAPTDLLRTFASER